METLILYLLKSSGLIAMFYLAYYFLLRKETFFTSNRWFLLAGLVTSLLLPFFTIKKVIYVDKPKINLTDIVSYTNVTPSTSTTVPAVEAFDWLQIIWVSYIIIASLLVIKIIFNLISLFQMLYQQQKVKKERFTYVDLNHDIAPFSFFNYIVYNSELYTQEELQSILLHEKIHSQEFHSLDVIITKLFTIIFWFNPFIWLYKKAIAQNLEYIADQKAVAQLEDAKVYQRALLKVVSNQNCLSITNNFYQSLIKKRIVMLNKNQSNKRNSWKYVLIIPALLCFVLLFQIKTIAQERALQELKSKQGEVSLVIDKNSSEEELKKEAKRIKEEHGVTLKYSKIKRNSNGEITGIKVEYKDKNGNKGVSQVNGKEPITPIHFYKNGESIGFGKAKSVRIIANGTAMNLGDDIAFNFLDSIPEIKDFDFNFDFEVPEVSEVPEVPEAPEAPETPETTTKKEFRKSSVIIKKDGDKKPTVIINGKIVTDEKEAEEMMKKIGGNGKAFYFNSDDDTEIVINEKELSELNDKAMAKAKVYMRKMKPEMKIQIEKQKDLVRKEMEKVKEEMERIKPEMEKARREQEQESPDLEKARAEMIQAKEEMLKAKAEMDAARAELEKAKAALKKQKRN